MYIYSCIICIRGDNAECMCVNVQLFHIIWYIEIVIAIYVNILKILYSKIYSLNF